MVRLPTLLGASLFLMILAGSQAWAGSHEIKTVESAAEVIHALTDIPLHGIPRSLLHEAAGVAIIPHVVKAGLVIDVRMGRGVIVRHEPNGTWSNPVFVTLAGSGIGGQAGLEATDLVLVFKTKESLERALRGKLALGTDVTIAAGPLGRDAEVASDRRLLKVDICSYSRSRGLFAGVSLEGSHLHLDAASNRAFYGLREGQPAEIHGYHGPVLASAEALKAQLAGLSGTPPALVVPLPPPPRKPR